MARFQACSDHTGSSLVKIAIRRGVRVEPMLFPRDCAVQLAQFPEYRRRRTLPERGESSLHRTPRAAKELCGRGRRELGRLSQMHHANRARLPGGMEASPIDSRCDFSARIIVPIPMRVCGRRNAGPSSSVVHKTPGRVVHGELHSRRMLQAERQRGRLAERIGAFCAKWKDSSFPPATTPVAEFAEPLIDPVRSVAEINANHELTRIVDPTEVKAGNLAKIAAVPVNVQVSPATTMTPRSPSGLAIIIASC